MRAEFLNTKVPDLSLAQHEFLRVRDALHRKLRRAPRVRELGAAYGCGPGGVQHHIVRLRALGILSRNPHGGVALAGKGIPLLGEVG